ncbi:MAG: magnesium transporter CorA family protein [Lachnospiraceae bacterium]|nr:magnesium transporter CorA family protein [Lachnospiraceae bacterium]
MLNMYKTDDRVIREIEKFEEGCWIKLTDPTLEECAEVSEQHEIDIADLRAALDDEESSRMSLEDDYTLIIVDIPTAEVRNNRHTYTTIPLGILVKEDVLITVCSEETAVLRIFIDQRVREFSTKKQMRFTYQILYNASMVYQSLLRSIDRKRTEIEERIDQESTENVDLVDLHELESNLVYFATSLRANGVVLDRLTRYGRLRQYEEDQELLEDVIIENRQAIEMTQIYRDIINGTRELLSTVINNRLNNAMKYLAAITIVMSIPTIVSGLWGMNVSGKWMPFSDTPHGFLVICLATLVISIIAMWILHKRKML